MAVDYIQYRWLSSPSWFLNPYGLQWSAAFGAEENAIYQETVLGVKARFPTLAPLDGDASGTSQALALIGNDRALLPTFGDNSNLDLYRAYLQTGFTQDATSSPLPVNPQAPGYYYAGTYLGAYAAYVNSGFWTTDASGNFVGPQFYRTQDFNNNSNFGGPVDPVGYSPELLTIGIHVTSTGTPGTSGAVFVKGNPTGNPTWASGTTYAAGDFVKSAHGDNYYAAIGGTSGSSNPFSSSTPSDSTWPPTAGMSVQDNGIQWVFSTFSPIPTVLPLGPSWGLDFGTTSVSSGSYDVFFDPEPPDGRTDAWARVWLVLPVSHLLDPPLLWGNGGAGEYSGYWGRSPGGTSTSAPPTAWGAGTQLQTGQSVYGLISTIAQRWLPAHVRLIGAWVTWGTTTQIDGGYSSPWNELNATFGGQTLPFFRFNGEVQTGY